MFKYTIKNWWLWSCILTVVFLCFLDVCDYCDRREMRLVLMVLLAVNAILMMRQNTCSTEKQDMPSLAQKNVLLIQENTALSITIKNLSDKHTLLCEIRNSLHRLRRESNENFSTTETEQYKIKARQCMLREAKARHLHYPSLMHLSSWLLGLTHACG